MAPALLNDAGNITLGRDDQWNMGARSRPRNSYQGASSYSYALIIISPRLLIWIMISRYLSPWCGHPGAVNKERLGLAKDFNQERNSRKNLGNSPADQSGPKHWSYRRKHNSKRLEEGETALWKRTCNAQDPHKQGTIENGTRKIERYLFIYTVCDFWGKTYKTVQN